ncbi:hypothetical protein [Thiococcus pfennigii]|jgi:hypothetical protein|uniref:hypothetical protein n=1 Tax=Thiococcus pfennigii TaxID=1057 RepID=UPI0019038A24|nr:hypothetical protein [Thiococcus pfennigii]
MINSCLHEAARAVVDREIIAGLRALVLVRTDDAIWLQQGEALLAVSLHQRTKVLFLIGRCLRAVVAQWSGEVFRLPPTPKKGRAMGFELGDPAPCTRQLRLVTKGVERNVRH